MTLFVLLCRCYPFGRKDSRRGCRQFFSMLDSDKEDAYPPKHARSPAPLPSLSPILPPLRIAPAVEHKRCMQSPLPGPTRAACPLRHSNDSNQVVTYRARAAHTQLSSK